MERTIDSHRRFSSYKVDGIEVYRIHQDASLFRPLWRDLCQALAMGPRLLREEGGWRARGEVSSALHNWSVLIDAGLYFEVPALAILAAHEQRLLGVAQPEQLLLDRLTRWGNLSEDYWSLAASGREAQVLVMLGLL